MTGYTRYVRIRATGAAVMGALLACGVSTALVQPGAARQPASAAVTPPTVAARYQSSPADERIASLLPRRLGAARLGSRVGVLVGDPTTGATVWSRNAGTPFLPASNTKVATAVAALSTFPADTRFRTFLALAPRPAGARSATLVLVGEGDPSLTTAGVERLAAGAASELALLGVRTVRVQVDDTLFPAPTPARGWLPDYSPHQVAPVRPLIVDQREVMDTGLDAGRILARSLSRQGVTVTGVRRGRVPTGASTVAEVRGERLDSIVRTMLTRSDNDIAEYLFRLVALRTGHRPDWAGAAAAERKVLARLGVPLDGVRLYDGSGLSRSNRMTAASLVHLMRLAVSPEHPELRAVYVDHGMPVSGRTGTLSASRGRYDTAPSSCARDHVVAKTGTLRDVVTLAGVARAADGRPRVFAILVNGPASSMSVKRKVDALAATVTGCW